MTCPTPCDTLLIKDIIAPAASALTALLVAGVGYGLALRQLKKKSQMDVREDLRKRQANALQAAWALLQSLTQVDNGQNIVRVVRGKDGSTSHLLHLRNAQIFVFERLPAAFYEQGAGLLWSSDIKEKIFESRNILYGMLLSEGQAHVHEPSPATIEPKPSEATGSAPRAKLVSIHKPEAAQRLQVLYEELNQLLRKEMQAVYAPIF